MGVGKYSDMVRCPYNKDHPINDMGLGFLRHIESSKFCRQQYETVVDNVSGPFGDVS